MTAKTWNQWVAGSLSVQRYEIRAGEWITVDSGCVLTCNALRVLIVNGVLRLDGVIVGA